MSKTPEKHSSSPRETRNEGDKQKSKKRRTRPGVEEDLGGALSTTQKMSFFKRKKDVFGSSKWQDPPLDSQPIGGTQILYSDSQPVLETQYTQQLNERETASDFQPVLETQYTEEQYERSPDDQFRDVNPESIPYIGIEDPNRLMVQNSPQIVGNYCIGNTIIPKATVNTILTAAVDVNFHASDDMFTPRESYMLANMLTEQRRLYESGKKVGLVINTLRLNFEHYCGLMKKGKKSKVIRYDYDSGICFPTALDQGEWSVVWNQYQHVIENFEILKKLFPKIHNLPQSSTISGKRKSSTVGTSRGSKKSKSTSSVNNLYSSKTLRVKFRIKNQVSFVSEDFLHELLVRYFEGNDAKCLEFLEYNDDRFRYEILKMLCAIRAGGN